MAITATEDPPATTAPFGAAARLSCRECGETYDIGPKFACEFCFGPLQVSYDFPEITREQIAAGPASMWRYAPLLPVPADVASKPNLNPGFTKLINAGNLARELGMRSLHVKDDSGNPTHSFKDRVVAVALEAARNFGYTTLSCSSTGNLAGAVTAAAARAGLRACVFIPAGLEQGKVVMASVYGGDVVALEGTYDEVNRFCTELIGDATAAQDWGFVNVNLRTFYGEGSKTLAYEIVEQLSWRIPEQLVIPIASGAQLTKIDKGLQELIKLGLVEDRPYKIFGAQATGCSPVATAWKAGHDVVKPVKPDTIAKSLAIGNPADGPYVLDICKRTGGAVEDVSDPEIVDAIKLLARTEGVFAETAGGVTVGVLRKLLADGALDPEAETVVLNTGDGLKTLDAVGGGPTATIRPSLEEFRKAGLV